MEEVKPMIIGISGYARAGKNTVADILGPDYRQVSFAQAIKDALYTLDPIIEYDGDFLGLQHLVDGYGWDRVKEDHQESRRMLQRFGKEVGRDMFGENFWVDIAMKDVKVGDDVVFTDVRFPNEAQAIVNRGGEVWRINRPGIVAYNAHVSETSLDDWKFHKIIENDGTLEQLKEKVFG